MRDTVIIEKGDTLILTFSYRNGKPFIAVDYRHPFGDLPGVLIDALQTTPPENSRPIMSLYNPRCARCGLQLTQAALGNRIIEGGDLYDKRFKWNWPRPPRAWWQFWKLE